MKKVMTILAVAALYASTAFAGGLDETTEDSTTIVQTPPSGMFCTSSVGEIAACATVALCAGGLCGGGSSSNSSNSSDSSSSSDSM